MAARYFVATMLFFAAARKLATAFVSALVATAAIAAGFTLAAPQAQAATSDNVVGWAWSSSIGWISMNCVTTSTCGTSNYGVTISETAGAPDRAEITGYAWSEIAGWICFGTTCTGTTPEGGASYGQYRKMNNGQADQFWGWAKIVNMGNDGWISLNCDWDVEAVDRAKCAAGNYYVRLNNANGNFTAGQPNDRYAWGHNSLGIGAGWIDFLTVSTTWVPAKLGKVIRPEGIYEPQTTAPGTHRSDLVVQFQNFSATIGQFVECEIRLPDNSLKFMNKVMTSSVRNGAQTLAYTITSADNVQINKLWYAEKCRIAGATLGAACSTSCTGSACNDDATCAGAGAICDENIDRCRGVLITSDDKKPIYTHGNTWSGLESSQDQARALDCFQSTPGTYFNNSSQCEFTADMSYALAMRRGIPIEGNCGDGIDNDGNGQIDCADRYCKGISYRCAERPPLQCRWGVVDTMADCTDAGYVAGNQCCTRQPVTSGSTFNTVVNGVDCTYNDPKDGYFDCDCKTAANANTTTGCYAPYHQTGDVCCNSDSEVDRN